MVYIIVGIGGMLGSMARYSIGRLINKYFKASFPYATFIINITGAFLLGAASALHSSGTMYLLVCEGFLGAFTTFSTFMYEGFSLIKDNRHMNALVYIAATVLLGVTGFGLGYYGAAY